MLSAFTAPSWIYAEPINKFNRYNTEYYVTVKPYFNYDYDEYDTALTRFYNDLITGNGADLFWFNIDDNLEGRMKANELYNKYHDGNSAKRIVDYIEEKMKGNKSEKK